jgi:hypothetical protein
MRGSCSVPFAVPSSEARGALAGDTAMSKNDGRGRAQIVNDREPEPAGSSALAGRIKAAIQALLDRYRGFVGRK